MTTRGTFQPCAALAIALIGAAALATASAQQAAPVPSFADEMRLVKLDARAYRAALAGRPHPALRQAVATPTPEAELRLTRLDANAYRLALASATAQGVSAAAAPTLEDELRILRPLINAYRAAAQRSTSELNAVAP